MKIVENQIFVTDLKSAEEFYSNTLGLRLIQKSDEWLIYNPGIEFIVMAGARSKKLNSEYGKVADTVLCFEVKKIEDVVESLKSKRVRFLNSVTTVPQGKFVSFADPDGNLFELIERPQPQAYLNFSAKKVLVVLGTARDDSNTLRALKNDADLADKEIIELHKLKINPYKYGEIQDDDFLKVIAKVISSDFIVFATPVYWYAMSGQLKTFFDRMTDLITTSKKLGRELEGKEVLLFATGSDTELPEGFEVPFKKTCEYLEVKYVGCRYEKALIDAK